MTDVFKITQGCKIVNGPSREDIFDSLLRLFPEQRTVKFQLVNSIGPVVTARIIGIQPDGGSGHIWNLRVQFVGHPEVDVYYNSTRREGAVVDERPLKKRVTIDRQGRV